MKKHFQQKGWVVKNTRPEEEYQGKAGDYYNKEVSSNYAKSRAMRKMQEKITIRAIELANFKPNSLILDLGAGAGHSTKLLKKKGFKTKAVDTSIEMIKQAKKRGIKVIKADMRQLPFKENEFDGAISISALQWLLEGTTQEKKEKIEKTATEIRRTLKPETTAVIQFYPKTEEELKLVSKTFLKQGFEVKIAEDNPNQKNKRKIYLVLKNKKNNPYFSEIYEKAWKKKQEEKYKKAIQLLKKYLEQNKEALDIGTGQAWFYEKLLKKGFKFKKVTAIEPDEKMQNKNKEKTKKMNINYFTETFEKWSEKNKNKRYDYLISFDSLHLLKKPTEAIKHLKKGGVSFIAVPIHFENLLNKFNEKNIIEKGVMGKQEKDAYIIIKKS